MEGLCGWILLKKKQTDNKDERSDSIIKFWRDLRILH